MLQALALARDILSLGEAAASLITGIVNLVRGHDERSQRAALDAAYRAVEDALAKRMRP